MLDQREWLAFRDSGLLWWVNRSLHLFGWVIVFDYDDSGNLNEVYPAHCKFRGFGEVDEGQGFARLTRHLEHEMPRIAGDLSE